MNPRIALLGFSIECNRWAPVTSLPEFENRCLLRGPAILTDARSPAPRALGEMPGFVTTMDETGPWRPHPIMLAMAEPSGPVDHAVFQGFLAEWRVGLEALRGDCDGAYAVLHGAALTTELHDPEAALQALVREVLGDIPFICSYDLHANVSAENVALNDAFIGYRTNPHVDMRARGAESAHLMLRMVEGETFLRAHRRLPIMAPTVSMLTAQGPYAEVIDLGQARMAEAQSIAHVAVMGGFAYGDTPFNGMTVVVTGTKQHAAEALADELARACWERRDRFVGKLTSIPDCLARLAASPVPLAFADVADNPGGGGSGNTMEILRAFVEAGLEHAAFGCIIDPDLAAEAHALGAGAGFTARFNRAGGDAFSKPFEAPAMVRALSDGQVTGRRGLYAGVAMRLGATAWLQLGGIAVVVISSRAQCADPAFFEHLGIDLTAMRAVVVKSRGHFRAGFDEYFSHEQVVEVDGPGLTSPIFSRFDWRHIPRPMLPLDAEAFWP